MIKYRRISEGIRTNKNDYRKIIKDYNLQELVKFVIKNRHYLMLSTDSDEFDKFIHDKIDTYGAVKVLNDYNDLNKNDIFLYPKNDEMSLCRIINGRLNDEDARYEWVNLANEIINTQDNITLL